MSARSGASHGRPKRPRFAFDQNFPLPVLLDIVARVTPELDLVPLSRIDDRLGGLDDNDLIRALWQAEFQGIATCDADALELPQVVAMIEQTRFSYVALERVGDKPLEATGLLLAQLRHVAKRHDPLKPQVWRLRTSERQPMKFADLKQRVERQSKQQIDSFRLSPAELAAPVLDA